MTATHDLDGKVAVVTGSSRGIGAAIALKLAQRGAALAINYRTSAEAADAVASQIRALGVRAITVQADVSDQAAVRALFDTVVRELGRVDIVVSNAGIEHFGAVDTVTDADFDAVFAVNVKGQYFVAQAAAAHMADFGRIMLTSSISAVKGVPRHAVYAASKAAVQGLTRCLAADLGPRNITVNCIAAGGVKSDMYDENARKYIPGGADMTDGQVEALLSKWSPLGRVGVPEDVSGVVALIASPDAQWLTGQTFHVSGGAYMT
ncbi:hypothetical protein N7462_003556 [Penicillium macrosclerotiorum]|uniref:uncharacterized protein n=1 Tax=Penicillium macrosclerotiorum TaxID=303699 RepID=UPI0025479E91|nr:uncharacterized protein N7462_003556 [Penicillium macrosclerotiorum]KAJ5689164.1 hypothetical protein N7462_003556 [Penicillium macrosclerotiorum]